MHAGLTRAVSTSAMALCLAALTLQAPSALATTLATPVPQAAAALQPRIGTALSGTQNTGVLGWIATSMTQMPALGAASVLAPGGAMEQLPPATVPAQPTAQPQIQ